MPKLIGALIILVVGFFIVKVISWIIGAVVKKTGAGNKIAPYLGGNASKGGGDGLAKGLGKGAFWIAMMFIAITCLNALDLTIGFGWQSGLWGYRIDGRKPSGH